MISGVAQSSHAWRLALNDMPHHVLEVPRSCSNRVIKQLDSVASLDEDLMRCRNPSLGFKDNTTVSGSGSETPVSSARGGRQ